MKKAMFIILYFTLVMLDNANAECRKSYVCDDYNNCSYIDICDNTLDLPSTDIDPLPPLSTTKLKPLPSMDLPPLGTSECTYMMVNGEWQNVCH
jgi:hypothetical protein